MNVRMMELLDLLAQREREDEEPGYMEILPPLHAEIELPRALAKRRRFPVLMLAAGELQIA